MNLFGYEICDKNFQVIEAQIDSKIETFPPQNLRFKALELTPLKTVKIVILGQDPYHGKGQAHGLSFSVLKGVKLPPSLRNIFKEIETEFSIKMPQSGNLEPWAKQGVLLLNSVLSVEAGKPASHAGLGWENVTDSIISQVSQVHENVVFLLWGAYAQKKALLIDETKHMVLKTTHPSPFSAYKGFLGCGHFKEANMYLEEHHKTPIDWVLK